MDFIYEAGIPKKTTGFWRHRQKAQRFTWKDSWEKRKAMEAGGGADCFPERFAGRESSAKSTTECSSCGTRLTRCRRLSRSKNETKKNLRKT